MVSFIRPEIKYFIRAGELSFLSPSDDTRGKGDNSSSPRVLPWEENRSCKLQAKGMLEAVELYCVTPGPERKNSERQTEKEFRKKEIKKENN